jgi:hypothetical protein
MGVQIQSAICNDEYNTVQLQYNYHYTQYKMYTVTVQNVHCSVIVYKMYSVSEV